LTTEGIKLRGKGGMDVLMKKLWGKKELEARTKAKFSYQRTVPTKLKKKETKRHKQHVASPKERESAKQQKTKERYLEKETE